ncbi:MAG: hypothetical protein D6723_04530 [Acidobacteria bacterium]|nr:MAG: hypothetical protein D6723_04530 [Acidobacteriota bacterium]
MESAVALKGIDDMRNTRDCLIIIFIFSASLLAALSVNGATVKGAAPQLRLTTSRIILGAGSHPFSFPETFAVDRAGDIYVADSDLATVFKFDARGDFLWKLTGTPPGERRFRGIADLTVDDQDRVWVLEGLRSVVHAFTSSGRYLRSVHLRHIVRRIAVNRRGEIIANSSGPHLFDVYSPGGRYLRSFGRRLVYASRAADYELNTGHLAVGPNDEVYFSFFYPPRIRAYQSDGILRWETAISFDRAFPEPRISQMKQDGNVAISFNYYLASLDLDVDEAGRIYCLVAGQPKIVALTQGSDRVDIFSPGGERLGSLRLPARFHRLAVRQGHMYLLANRKPMRLERFSLTEGM